MVWACLHVSSAQNALPIENVSFSAASVSLKGRLVDLTVHPFPHLKKDLILVLTREGEYPRWSYYWSLFAWNQKNKKLEMQFQKELPTKVWGYDLISSDSDPSLYLVALTDTTIMQWHINPQLELSKQLNTLDFSRHFSSAANGDPGSIELIKVEDQWLIPHHLGAELIRFNDGRKMEAIRHIPWPVKSYTRSDRNTLPLEFKYWKRQTRWWPKPYSGNYGTQKADTAALFLPWVDELFVLDPKTDAVEQVVFGKLTEAERDNRLTNVVLIPQDLNGNGKTDLILNKFKGSFSDLRAETYLYFSDGAGKLNPKKGKALELEADRASGALPVDIDGDQKYELAVASGQFNVWAIVRALTRGEVNITFSIFGLDGGFYDTSKPLFSRVISFGFDLSNLSIEGFFPTLEGDFNGDGKNDVFYARDRTEFSILYQNNSKEMFSGRTSVNFSTPLLQKVQLGDFDGDGKTDILTFDTRWEKNRKLQLLMNRL